MALGFKRPRLTLLYVEESFILVLSSSFLGILVGTLAAFTMVAQFSSFNNIPVSFDFPWVQTLFIFAGSLLCAVLSTLGPTKSILKQQIASILKSA